MDYIECVRKLAKDNEHQNIYVISKEIGSIKLFENDNNFTFIQHLFLKYLNFYYNLYTDISLGEVSDIVLESDLYSDSYMMWKTNNEKDKFKNMMNEKPIPSKNRENVNPLNTSTWIFKNPKK